MLRLVSHGARAGGMFAGPDLGERAAVRLCTQDKRCSPTSFSPGTDTKPQVPDFREVRESVPDFRHMRTADTHMA